MANGRTRATRGSRADVRRGPAVLMLALWLAGPSGVLAAPPLADPAAGPHRPTVDATPNGLPLVQITDPSAGGVSRNQFTRFDVEAGGVVLNNGTGISKTELAGYVAANPNLRSSAAVILNEVTGANASELRGYLEVAGRKAEVVIANPNGITCDGCGFINVSRGTLTTGTPVFGGSGSLDAFRVVGGSIRVEGAGLDATSTERLDLLGRAIALNAGVWAQRLDVVGGPNLVDRAGLAATPIAGTWPPPAVTIDVGALGGMYAGKIRLVGTERGLGVASAGHLASTGEFTLESSGRIVLAGEVTAAGALRLSGEGLSNTGVLYGEGAVELRVQGELVNDGLIAGREALDVDADRVSSAGTLAAGITRSEELTAPGTLDVQAGSGLDAAGGRLLAGGTLKLDGASVSLAGASVQAGAGIEVTTDGHVLATGATLETDGALIVRPAGSFSGGGAVLRGGSVEVTAGSIDLGGGARVEAVGDLALDSRSHLIAPGASFRSGGNMRGTSVELLDVTGAELSAAELDLDGKTVLADHARLVSAGSLDATASEGLLGLLGSDLAAAGAITATSVGSRVDAGGARLRGGTIELDGASIELSRGDAESVGEVTLTARAGDIQNASGRIAAGGLLSANATGGFANLGGTVIGRGIQIVADSIDSRGAGAGIFSAGDLSLLGTKAVRNELGSALYAAGNLLVGALRDEEIVYTALLVNSGTIEASGSIRLEADQLADYSEGAPLREFDPVTGAQVGAAGPGPTRPEFQFEVPPGGMFRTNPDPGRPLVETDPRFTDFRTFLTSDYMLSRLPTTPEASLKRLGDGFVEEQLVLDQITYLTGRRFLDGYDDAQAQFQALMDEGLQFAEKVGLGVGVELSAEMTAGLTAPLVWMVKVQVDGQDVLVPKVYVPAAQEIAFGRRGGTITAGKTLAINTSGDFTLSRRFVAGQSLEVEAQSVRGDGERYSAAQDLKLTARKDVDLRGTELEAGRDLALTSREGDVKVTAEKKTTVVDLATGGQQYDVTAQGAKLRAGGAVKITAEGKGGSVLLEGASVTSGGGGGIEIVAGRDVELRAVEERHLATKDGTLGGTDSVHQAGSALSAGNGRVLITAGNDATLESARVEAGADVLVTAGGNLTLAAKNDSVSSGKKEGRTITRTYDETVQATTMQGGGAVTLSANGTGEGKGVLRTEGAVVQAGGGLEVRGADVQIADAREEHDSVSTSSKSKKGFLSKKTTTTRDEVKQDLSVGSVLSGGAVLVQSGGDLLVQGSQIVGGGDVRLTAGGDVRIAAGEDRITETHERTVTESGLLGSSGGLGITVGRRQTKSTSGVDATSHLRSDAEGKVTTTGSLVGSVEGNVVVEAQGLLDARGSDFTAKKDLSFSGEDVKVDAVYDVSRTRDVTTVTQDGVSVGVSNGLIDAGMKVANPLHRSTEVKDERLQGLYALRAMREIQGLQGAAQAMEQNAPGARSLSVTVGVSHSESRQESTTVTSTALGSNLTAEGKVSIIARGDPDHGDVTIIGSSVKGGTVELDAARDLVLRSAENRMETSTDSQSWSASVGVGVKFGAGGGAGVTVAGGVGLGDERTSDVTHSETVLQSSGAIVLKSGRDAVVQGGVVKGDSIQARVGRDLLIQSEQDASTYRSTDVNLSGSATVGPAPGASLTAGYAATESTYRSVQEQSGLFAGKGGYDVQVGGNTHLGGGVIASEAEEAKNRIDTNTFTHSEIENVSKYSAVSASVTVGIGAGGGITPSVGVPITGEKSSTTHAAVSPGTINVRSGEADLSTLSRDTAGATNTIGNSFDRAKIEEQKELVQVFGEEGFKAVGDLAEHYTKPFQDAERLEDAANSYKELLAKGDNLTDKERQERELFEKGGFTPDNVNEALGQADATKRQYQEQYDRWKDGSAMKTALHAGVGALQAGLGGGSIIAGGVGAGASEHLSGKTAKLPGAVKPFTSLAIGAAAGALAGGGGLGALTGGAVADYGAKYNRDLHLSERDRIRQIADHLYGKLGYATPEEAYLALEAVGCAMVRCADQLATSDPAFSEAAREQMDGKRLIEDRPDLERVLTAASDLFVDPGGIVRPMFSYSTGEIGLTDEATDAMQRLGYTGFYRHTPTARQQALSWLSATHGGAPNPDLSPVFAPRDPDGSIDWTSAHLLSQGVGPEYPLGFLYYNWARPFLDLDTQDGAIVDGMAAAGILSRHYSKAGIDHLQSDLNQRFEEVNYSRYGGTTPGSVVAAGGTAVDQFLAGVPLGTARFLLTTSGEFTREQIDAHKQIGDAIATANDPTKTELQRAEASAYVLGLLSSDLGTIAGAAGGLGVRGPVLWGGKGTGVTVAGTLDSEALGGRNGLTGPGSRASQLVLDAVEIEPGVFAPRSSAATLPGQASEAAIVRAMDVLDHGGAPQQSGVSAAGPAGSIAVANSEPVASPVVGLTKPLLPSGTAASVRAIERSPLDWSRINPAGETAYTHVNLHGVNDLTKPLHSVFTEDPAMTTQEAWWKAQADGILPTPQGPRDVYIVPMDRPVGWQGGYRGSGGILTNVQIVVQRSTNQVVTAFPK